MRRTLQQVCVCNAQCPWCASYACVWEVVPPTHPHQFRAVDTLCAREAYFPLHLYDSIRGVFKKLSIFRKLRRDIYSGKERHNCACPDRRDHLRKKLPARVIFQRSIFSDFAREVKSSLCDLRSHRARDRGRDFSFTRYARVANARNERDFASTPGVINRGLASR